MTFWLTSSQLCNNLYEDDFVLASVVRIKKDDKYAPTLKRPSFFISFPMQSFKLQVSSTREKKDPFFSKKLHFFMDKIAMVFSVLYVYFQKMLLFSSKYCSDILNIFIQGNVLISLIVQK